MQTRPKSFYLLAGSYAMLLSVRSRSEVMFFVQSLQQLLIYETRGKLQLRSWSANCLSQLWDITLQSFVLKTEINDSCQSYLSKSAIGAGLTSQITHRVKKG